jgi:TIR domain
MSSQVRVFLSYDRSDAAAAADLKRQLAIALQPRSLDCWDKKDIPVEDYRKQSGLFLESTQLFIAVLSNNYEDQPDVRWEYAQAVEKAKNHPQLQILTVKARETAIPALLYPFKQALPPGETLAHRGISPDIQIKRAIESAVSLVAASPRSNDIPAAAIDLPIYLVDIVERMRAQTDRINHAPLIQLLKSLIENVQVKRVVLDIEEGFKQLREQTRLAQISMRELREKGVPLQINLQHLIQNLQEEDLVPTWKQVFIRDYFRFVPGSRETGLVPPFFVPSDEIAIPETLNLPVGPREEEALEQIGLLSFEQKNEFRRRLLLAKDAIAVNNFSQAFEHCDYVRNHIAPQSAQLYEFLLISYVQKETPERIMREATLGNPRLLHHVELFASRFRSHQKEGKCPSSTGNHNLAIASEAISDAALKIYHRFPNDPIRHTGKHAESVADNRRALRIILENTMAVCRLVWPAEELLEAAVTECCGAGKCHWIQRVDVVGEHFRFMPNGHFDLLGEIRELIALMQGMEADEPGKIVKENEVLREDIWFGLLAKRQALAHQIETDEKRQRPFTDKRESVIRFVYAALLGAEIFDETWEPGKDQSFYRLVLECLMPEILLDADPRAALGLRWFDFDTNGNLTAHPDCAKYQFDALAIVEHITGNRRWYHVRPNLRSAVWQQMVHDIDAAYEQVRKGLSYTDFRRMNDQDARRQLIHVLQRWEDAYHVNPEQGRYYLERCVAELCGDGLMLWMHHDPDVPLSTHTDSLGQGFDAVKALEKMRDMLLPHSLLSDEPDIDAEFRRRIAENLFHKRILPAYNALKSGQNTARPMLERLLKEALSNYKLHPEIKYLDFVWSELTEEKKLAWVRISDVGVELPMQPSPGFDPLQILDELFAVHPRRYKRFDARQRIATSRHRDLMDRYLSEISEFRHENRRPERAIAIEILRSIKGVYRYYPQESFLELPLRELENRGRIRWHARFLGVFPTRENHYENQFYKFNFRFELIDFGRLLQSNYEELTRVMRDTGEL